MTRILQRLPGETDQEWRRRQREAKAAHDAAVAATMPDIVETRRAADLLWTEDFGGKAK